MTPTGTRPTGAIPARYLPARDFQCISLSGARPLAGVTEGTRTPDLQGHNLTL
jgi:hypothetical protein